MILWLDGMHGARENMRRDADLLEAASAGLLHEPVLRLFGFAPPGITLGRGQDAARELDVDRLAAEGVEWANRPTGGRAIWHDEEWTFSLTRRVSGPGAVAGAYAETCALLAAALRRLGVPVELSPGSARGPGGPRRRGGPAPPCFASSARHELTLHGRKFAGVAQRRVRGALLQQGSLLLGDSHLHLADFLLGDEASRAAARRELGGAAAHAGDALGPRAPLARLAAAIGETARPSRMVEGEGGLALAAPARVGS